MKKNDVRVNLKENSKNICDIKIPNGMNGIHKKEVNKITECNLIHDILNPYKLIKTF